MRIRDFSGFQNSFFHRFRLVLGTDVGRIDARTLPVVEFEVAGSAHQIIVSSSPIMGPKIWILQRVFHFVTLSWFERRVHFGPNAPRRFDGIDGFGDRPTDHQYVRPVLHGMSRSRMAALVVKTW